MTIQIDQIKETPIPVQTCEGFFFSFSFFFFSFFVLFSFYFPLSLSFLLSALSISSHILSFPFSLPNSLFFLFFFIFFFLFFPLSKTKDGEKQKIECCIDPFIYDEFDECVLECPQFIFGEKIELWVRNITFGLLSLSFLVLFFSVIPFYCTGSLRFFLFVFF